MIGAVLNKRYRILEPIGEGGMAAVYKATDLRLQREVAVKILHAQYAKDPDLSQRFAQEAHIAARLEHDNILKVYDFGVHDDSRTYIVFELLRGQNFHEMQVERLRRTHSPFDIFVCTMVCEEILKALSCAHAQGIVHRDVKPDNVVITAEGFVKLMDFGIAKNPMSSTRTVVGHFLGSPCYSSPEQVQGGKIDFRSDLFSLGIILYEALTGRLPFDGKSAAEVMMKISKGTYAPIRTVDPKIPSELADVIEKALRSERTERYETSQAMQADLRHFLEDAGIENSRFGLESYFKKERAAAPSGKAPGQAHRTTGKGKRRTRKEQSKAPEFADDDVSLAGEDVGVPALVSDDDDTIENAHEGPVHVPTTPPQFEFEETQRTYAGPSSRALNLNRDPKAAGISETILLRAPRPEQAAAFDARAEARGMRGTTRMPAGGSASARERDPSLPRSPRATQNLRRSHEPRHRPVSSPGRKVHAREKYAPLLPQTSFPGTSPSSRPADGGVVGPGWGVLTLLGAAVFIGAFLLFKVATFKTAPDLATQSPAARQTPDVTVTVEPPRSVEHVDPPRQPIPVPPTNTQDWRHETPRNTDSPPPHHVKKWHENTHSYSQRVIAQEDRPTSAPNPVVEEHPLPPAIGRVSLQTVPASVPVYIDSTYAGESGAEGALKVFEVRPGRHTLTIKPVEVSGVRYDQYVRILNVESGHNVTLGAIRLRAVHSLTINIKGPDVVVVVNGESHALNGRPLELKLPEGHFEIEARASNGRTWKRNVEIRSEDVRVQTSLE